ncbi:cyclic nucleotide-binding domain-containing protein 2-like [Plakobranchus ocellatus]|uniref:Cyclic nucleotide-binding domain-containing protein 2-like n=1 Tax=Plakobranchus ocellatus TaxID=259542 RepID=A0AAV4DFU9_9GAST|nr:cyclic nucleotide-binding domain-containing protein 2-like [Plakobranchus ocellatus]
MRLTDQLPSRCPSRLFKTFATGYQEEVPPIKSPYDEKMEKYVQKNTTLYSNKVYIPWYRRYVHAIPDIEQQEAFQPYREIQTRDEDIALQYLYGTHECMHANVISGKCRLSATQCKYIRELSMSKYTRAQERLETQKEIEKTEDHAFTSPGRDIDLTSEFGYSENKKKMVLPAINFLLKQHHRRRRNFSRRPLSPSSKWLKFKSDQMSNALKRKAAYMKQKQTRNKIRRIFSLVFYVIRFIKCVAMIAGDTQTLLKDPKFTRVSHDTPTEEKTGKEWTFFNVHAFQKAGQVQVPFHIQLILSKPWFTRTVKEVEAAVQYLEKMRSFTAYPRPFQLILARVAWYIELPTSKVVIRESQQSVNFYLLLNGSVRIDRLEGSPCEAEGGSFQTLRMLTSQDIFGDDCVTDPSSLRKYTATTEEECALLDFNMYDYNNMIQTAHTSEVAPDHIRFLW